MFAVFLELPIDFGIIDLFIDDPDTRLLIHVLAGDVPHLRVGARAQGNIALSAIERVDAVQEAPERWRRRHGIHPADTILVTPFDKPNCAMVPKPDAGVTLLHWQVRRAAPRYVLPYLDRPELLVRNVRQEG